ncbi:YvrJ family protein [Bacillus swezeyi]|uniref:YvrJ family protein n=1 Tax=Bacillus swezeyi TaxID=1925020 RepID=A0A1R1QCG7_9BACI|nr:YvrJ family protein [Bacillus swezeyi]MEC1259588.1 YvrJ family protein [Bacillus swezeyi]MED1739335.1 YvrJ family protein [Bacillus swezeyi]MED2927449.1 YvrJ family protein [Bacillus swezeyi]MED2941701.1 YvrJ family protein [Bacillus swezeyi]MED2962647.1 YvrJ family protein [Bacillus swezeyi]
MDSAFIEEAAKQIGNIGFPAVLSLYLLTRFEKKIDELIDLMKEKNGSVD